MLDKFRGCLLGLACGDALGAAVEFSPRGTFEPVTEMRGGGPFDLPPGYWTDDTSMALALADSLLECSGMNVADQARRYCEWMNSGRYSSTGECFDIGNTTRSALLRFEKTGEVFAATVGNHQSGNGALMRLAPVPMYFANQRPGITGDHCVRSSAVTHASAECLRLARAFGEMIQLALLGHSKEFILLGSPPRFSDSPFVENVLLGNYCDKSADDIRGSGYVVESLEAALWAFFTTDTLEAAILAAVNLGDDADTTGAICGQLAGAFYGFDAIPLEWLATLHDSQGIAKVADRLFAACR